MNCYKNEFHGRQCYCVCFPGEDCHFEVVEVSQLLRVLFAVNLFHRRMDVFQ